MIEDSLGAYGGPDGFVRFYAMGERSSGAFRCAECRYGIAIVGALPTCPMCGGTSWEADLRPAFRAVGDRVERA